jgi:hypothetical protein
MKMASCILLFLSVPNIMAQASQSQLGELAGRSVELSMVKSDDLSQVGWPVEPISLKEIPATLTIDRNIYALLQANGIAPDSEAFTLVYDLNPSITDVNAVSPNTSLQMPSISGGQELRKLLQAGDLVELTVDPNIRSQLNGHIESLQVLAASIDEVSSDPSTQTQLKSLIEWYQQIEKRFKRRTGPPLRRPTLVEMQSEAELLNSILESANKQNRQLAPDERAQIEAIYEDIRLEMLNYSQTLAGTAPKSQSIYSITVNIKGDDAALIAGLRVYYTYNGLFRPLPALSPISTYGFNHLGSGASENLPKKNYQIWAAKDGDANHPLAPPYLLRIDSTSSTSLSVDLSLQSESRR